MPRSRSQWLLPSLQIQQICIHDVHKLFRWVNTRKAIRPHGSLRASTDQGATVSQTFFMFLSTLSLSAIPTWFKKSVIEPVPKRNKTTRLTDWWHIAFTISSKRFENHVRILSWTMLPNTGDTLQVGDHQNRSTADTHSLLSYTQPSLSPGKEQHPCTNAVCRLQFKIQHHSAL